MKRILTVGVFDLLHFGHMELFRKAKALGDFLIVAVQEDAFVTQFKPGTKLTYTEEQRSYMVASIRYVDQVVPYKTAESIVQQIDFDIFAHGPDQTNSSFIAAEKWCNAHHKEVVVLPRTEGISTSLIKEILKK
jgi:glycerol-3-phosphate cytidylyltransferase